MVRRPIKAAFIFRCMAAMVDERPKLPAGDWIAADVVARDHNFMLWGFVRVCFWIVLHGAAHDERPGRDFHKAQEWLIRQIPGIRAETRVAKPHQLVARRDTLCSAQVWRAHALE